MGWATILLAILQLVGPYIMEWIKKWLESRLTEAASTLPPFTTFGSSASAHDALFDAAIAGTPRRAFARRGLLRWLKKKGPVTALAPEDVEELRDLAGCCDNE